MIFVYNGAQFLVGNQQSGAGILHHEVQPLLRIAGIEWLESTASLYDSQRGDSHPLTTWNQDSYDILQAESLRCDIACNTVADFIYLCVCEPLVLKDNCCLIGRGLCLATEQRDDSLCLIVGGIGLVKTVEHFLLGRRYNADITQLFLSKEALYYSLITLQELVDQLLRILTGIVLSLHAVMPVTDIGFYIQSYTTGVVVQTLGSHGFVVKLQTVEQRSMPAKRRSCLQT